MFSLRVARFSVRTSGRSAQILGQRRARRRRPSLHRLPRSLRSLDVSLCKFACILLNCNTDESHSNKHASFQTKKLAC